MRRGTYFVEVQLRDHRSDQASFKRLSDECHHIGKPEMIPVSLSAVRMNYLALTMQTIRNSNSLWTLKNSTSWVRLSSLYGSPRASRLKWGDHIQWQEAVDLAARMPIRQWLWIQTPIKNRHWEVVLKEIRFWEYDACHYVDGHGRLMIDLISRRLTKRFLRNSWLVCAR